MKADEKLVEKVGLDVCPICGSEMEKGFYIVCHQTSWDVKMHKILAFLGEQITPPFMMKCKNFPASRCRKCKLIIFKYGEADDSANDNFREVENEKIRMQGTEEKFLVEYDGGHKMYSRVGVQGFIHVTSNYVKFKSNFFEFGFPIEKLRDVEIRTTSRVDWGKAWAFGVWSLLCGKEKYMEIVYEDENGKLQYPHFNFPDDSMDVRKTRLLKLLQNLKERQK